MKVKHMTGPVAGGAQYFSVEGDVKAKCRLLGLNAEVARRALELLLEVIDSGATRYKDVEQSVVAMIYVACRQLGIPITLHKICDELKINYKSVNRTFRQLVRATDISVPVISTTSYIDQLGSEMKLSPATITFAKRILAKLKVNGDISGKGRAGIAAAAICLASESKSKAAIQQKDIAEVAGVTQVTIRNRYKEMEEMLAGQ